MLMPTQTPELEQEMSLKRDATFVVSSIIAF